MAKSVGIYIKTPKEESKIIYVHNGGYVDYTLPLLKEHFMDIEKIRKLIALGDISRLRPRLAPEDYEKHSFANPQDDITLAYHRDRQDPLQWKGKHQTNRFFFNGIDWLMEFI